MICFLMHHSSNVGIKGRTGNTAHYFRRATSIARLVVTPDKSYLLYTRLDE